MVNVGPLEIMVVLVIALLVLGPQKLPDAARSVGKGIREFRGALKSGGDDEDEERSERRAERLPDDDEDEDDA